MPDQYTKTVTTGWGSRIMSSIKGIFIGFLLFLASFVLLYWNEGRVDVSKIAETATEIESTTLASETLDGALISSTGIFSSEEQLGDDYLMMGDYLTVVRTTEMYAWVEETETETKTNVGGSETTETTYTYEKEWIEFPADSSDFEYPTGHQNPSKMIDSKRHVTNNATLGIYNVNMQEVSLPGGKDLSLTEENVILDADMKLDGGYIFVGTPSSTLQKPEIGDLRISYTVLPNPIQKATIFGSLSHGDQSIEPSISGKKNTRLYRVFDSNREEAIATMHTEYTIMLWILRLVGFLMMWGGLAALLKPISTFLDVLPFLGSISDMMISAVTFVIAFILSLGTILISMLLHSLIAVIIMAVVVLTGGFMYMKNKGDKETPAPAAE